MLLPALCLNVDGAIGSTYNVTGLIARDIYNSIKNNDLNSARKYQNHLNDIITEILSNGLYQTLKEILKNKGVEGYGYCRLPLRKLTSLEIEIAKQISKKI